MKAVIHASGISGELLAPPSKSAFQRACALSLLLHGKTVIHNPGISNDDSAAINIIKALGAKLHFVDNSITIESTGIVKHSGIVNCGESGLSLRMFAPIAALANGELLLTGTGSLLKRPVSQFEGIFKDMEMQVQTNGGFLPVKIQGPLVPKDITLDGSSSSQYLTGLLFAFASSVVKRTEINVINLVSKPYIDLSMSMLSHFGFNVFHENYSHYFIEPATKEFKKITYHTESDWSNAAFFLVAAAISGTIRIKGLDLFSNQADRAIIDILTEAGATVSVEGSCIIVNKSTTLKGFEFDATDCPDLFPPLVALAAYCEGQSVIKGVSRLAGKESDRAVSLMDVFSHMGLDIKISKDVMIIQGGSGLHAAEVSSHNDHRIVMAVAIAALQANGPVTILNTESVNKSYPAFFDDLKMVAVTLSLTE